VASALGEEEKLLDDPDLRGIKSLKRKFRTMGNEGHKSKISKKDKTEQPEQHGLFPEPISEGAASISELVKLDEKYNDILKSSKALDLFHCKLIKIPSVASLASNQREILDRGTWHAYEKSKHFDQFPNIDACFQ
jgi:hypothetical protein